MYLGKHFFSSSSLPQVATISVSSYSLDREPVAMASTLPAAPAEEERRVVAEEVPGLITIYSDGSIERHTSLNVPACQDFVDGVASKDVVLDPLTGFWARIFLPQNVALHDMQTRVPVVLHFHGGGMCVGSPSTIFFHQFCCRMAVQSRSIWISVDYRLAPEHRLPAAYDDAYAALLWLQSQARMPHDASEAEPWLAQYADFSKCFFAGESAGGTIVHFLAVRAAGKDWSPIRIQGLLLIHAGFLQAMPRPKDSTDGFLSLARMEFYNRSSLPPGAHWGHPLVNPLHPDAPRLSQVHLPPALVAVADRDVLHDGAVEYYEALREAGKDAELFTSEGVGHCFHLRPPRSHAAEVLEKRLVEFMQKCSCSTDV